jgi:ATP-dependent helicase HrpB
MGDVGVVAAVLVERGLGGDDTDIAHRVERFARDRTPRATDMRRLADGWARQAEAHARSGRDGATSDSIETGALLALAYPDRIARTRGRDGEFVMANGRAGRVDPASALAREAFLVVADLTGTAANARILAAAPIYLETIEASFGESIEATTQVVFDRNARALRARSLRRLGALSLSERTLPVPPDLASAEILARGIAEIGLQALPWTPALTQWRARLTFLAQADPATWPDLSDPRLAETIEVWLAPEILGRTSIEAITADDLGRALQTLLSWDLRARLDAEAPTHVEVPTGSRIPLDYGAEGGPVLAVRVQELFGLERHPSIAGGRIPLVLHLLSPASRPIQITRDLPGFWRGSWSAVRSEMRGRYPRHPWPEDPVAEPPTRRVKPRGT